MIFRVTTFILVLCIGCRTSEKTAKMKALADENKDVVVLSHLIRDYMRKNHNTNFTLADILKGDTLGRITNNFSELEVGNWPDPWRGGYAVYFKFADKRNQDSIKLKDNEKVPWEVKTKKLIGRNELQLRKKFDGEIHFYYPERFYHVRGIIVKRPPR